MTDVNATVLDRSRGHVLVIDGDLFYSPNSSRRVRVPPSPTSGNVFNNPFICLADFYQPRWWTDEFGWLSFVPISPAFTGVPFDCLSYIPYRHETAENAGHRFSSSLAARWFRLEIFLAYATSCLAQACPVPLIRPFSPQAFGYQRTFKRISSVRRQATLSRDWFVIWMGMLSYLVARVERAAPQDTSKQSAVPTWFEILAQQDFDQGWLSGIYSSAVCSFLPDTLRAGVFLHIGGRDLPPVEFFCDYHVPVWYPWGPTQAEWARQHPWSARYAPLPQQLQAVASSLVRSPSSALHARGEGNAMQGENIVQHSTSLSRKKLSLTWQEFFAARERRHAKLEKHESQVFRWIVSEDPEADPDQRVRTLVTKAEHEDWFSFYGSKQQRYDPWENEWDLCSEFGDPDPDSDYDELDHDLTEAVDPNSCSESLPSRYSQLSPPPPHLTDMDDDSSPALTDPKDFIQVVVRHLGFVPPLTASPLTAGEIDRERWDRCMRALGLRQVDGSVPSSSSSSFDKVVVNFVHKIVNAQRPGENEWDLNKYNREALVKTGHLSNVLHISNVFLFDFTADSTSFPWRLALTTASDALYVCRMNASFDQYDVAHLLIEQGIPFYTLLPLRPIPSPAQPLIFPRLIPIRLSGYKFTTKDYAIYEQQRDAILSSPRGRAALLRGGIIWQLAKNSLSLDGALQGPSIITTVHRSGFSVKSTHFDDQLWDDDLSPEELDLLSGAYQCYTGHGRQMAIKSWWSLHTIWEKCGENHGRWTEWNEHLYQKRLREIEDGAEPLTASKWRDRLRGQKESRLLNKHNLRFSEEFIRSCRRL